MKKAILLAGLMLGSGLSVTGPWPVAAPVLPATTVALAAGAPCQAQALLADPGQLVPVL